MGKTNWIDAYGDNKVKKFQAGGEMAAPPAGGGQGPDLEGMLMEYAQSRDPQLAVAICDALVEMMAASQGAQGAPAAPAAGAPPMAKFGRKMSKAPVF